jgi:hypothetical protein
MKSIKSCASKQGQVSVLFSVLFAPLSARCSCATRCGAKHRRTHEAVADTCSKSLLRGNSHYGGAIRGESMCIRCVRGPYYEYHGRGSAVLPGVDIRCHAYHSSWVRSTPQFGLPPPCESESLPPSILPPPPD